MFARTVEQSQSPQEANLRKSIDRQGRRVHYATARKLASRVKQLGSYEALYRQLWPAEKDKIDAGRIRWIERVVEQIECGAPDSYGPVVVVGWPEQ
jgi:hypothetical protein